MAEASDVNLGTLQDPMPLFESSQEAIDGLLSKVDIDQVKLKEVNRSLMGFFWREDTRSAPVFSIGSKDATDLMEPGDGKGFRAPFDPLKTMDGDVARDVTSRVSLVLQLSDDQAETVERVVDGFVNKVYDQRRDGWAKGKQRVKGFSAEYLRSSSIRRVDKVDPDTKQPLEDENGDPVKTPFLRLKLRAFVPSTFRFCGLWSEEASDVVAKPALVNGQWLQPQKPAWNETCFVCVDPETGHAMDKTVVLDGEGKPVLCEKTGRPLYQWVTLAHMVPGSTVLYAAIEMSGIFFAGGKVGPTQRARVVYFSPPTRRGGGEVDRAALGIGSAPPPAVAARQAQALQDASAAEAEGSAGMKREGRPLAAAAAAAGGGGGMPMPPASKKQRSEGTVATGQGVAPPMNVPIPDAVMD